MSFVTAALIGAGGALVGGYLSSQGASSAASAQSAAAQQANATQLQMYNQQRADQTPWRNAGGSALGQLSYMMGLPGYGQGGSAWGQGGTMNGGSLGSAIGSGGQPPQMTPEQQSQWISSGYDPSMYQSLMGTSMTEGGSGDMRPQDGGGGLSGINPSMGGYGSLSTPFSQTNWQQDPGYQFRLSEGQKALERSGAAKGMTLSGAQQKAIQGYGQGMASQEYQNSYNRYNTDQNQQYNRLASMAGIGQTANAALGQAGTNYANNVSNNQMQLGAGQSAAALAGGNAWQGAINSGLNSWNNYNMWNALKGE